MWTNCPGQYDHDEKKVKRGCLLSKHVAIIGITGVFFLCPLQPTSINKQSTTTPSRNQMKKRMTGILRHNAPVHPTTLTLSNGKICLKIC